MPPGSWSKCSSSSARNIRVPIFVDREISSRVTPCFSRSCFSWAPNVATGIFSLAQNHYGPIVHIKYMLCEHYGKAQFYLCARKGRDGFSRIERPPVKLDDGT